MNELGGDPGASLVSGGLASRLDAFDQLLVKAAHHSRLLEEFLNRNAVNGRGLLLALLALLLMLILLPLTEAVLRRIGHVRPNFRGETIPQSVGAAIVIYAAVLLAACAALIPAARFSVMTWIIALVGFGALGLLDDVRGSREASGLRGHFRAAFRQRKITTGFVKAVGGLILTLTVAMRLHPESPVLVLLASLLIALSANAVNLLDLRPGRAGSVFLSGAITLIFFDLLRSGNPAGIPLLLVVAIPASRVYARDAAAKVMLGDAGSNPLGAALALAFLELAPPLSAQICLLIFLLALHILAERASLTALIEKIPALRLLDRMTGIRK